MVLELVCVEPIYPQYSGVLETCLALRYWFFEVLGSESVRTKFIISVSCEGPGRGEGETEANGEREEITGRSGGREEITGRERCSTVTV